MKLNSIILCLTIGMLSFGMSGTSFATNPASNYDSVEVLKERAAKGDMEAKSDLVIMYSYGVEGVEEDLDEAIRIGGDTFKNMPKLEMMERISNFAKRGNAKMQVWVGDMYRIGKFDELDQKETAYWYKLAADQGDADGLYKLAELYKTKDAEDYGVKYDFDEAIRLYKLAAEKGHEKGLESLKYAKRNKRIEQMRFDLRGKESDNLSKKMYGLKNPVTGYTTDSSADTPALKQLKDKAMHGDLQARADLTIIYLFGLDGVKVNETEARYWGNSLMTDYWKYCFVPYMCDFAKRRADKEMYLMIGDMYRFNFTDAVEAAKWYKLAAEAGSEEGMLRLGFLYELGICGLKVNLDEASRCYQMAADRGNKLGKESIEYIKELKTL